MDVSASFSVATWIHFLFERVNHANVACCLVSHRMNGDLTSVFVGRSVCQHVQYMRFRWLKYRLTRTKIPSVCICFPLTMWKVLFNYGANSEYNSVYCISRQHADSHFCIGGDLSPENTGRQNIKGTHFNDAIQINKSLERERQIVI
jgi:hypothetical protein